MHDGRITKKRSRQDFSSLPYATGRKASLGEGPLLPLAWRYSMRYYWEMLGETGFLIGGFAVGEMGEIASRPFIDLL